MADPYFLTRTMQCGSFCGRMPNLALSFAFLAVLLGIVLGSQASSCHASDKGSLQKHGLAAALASEDDAPRSDGARDALSTALLQTRADIRARVEAGGSPVAPPGQAASAASEPNAAATRADEAPPNTVRGLRALGVFLCACGLCWLLCCRGSGNTAEKADAEDVWHRRLAAQLWALNSKNTKVSSRTETSSLFPCCSSCCVFVCTPVLWVALLTAVPNAIMLLTDLAPDVVIHHPREYGRDYNKSEIWEAAGRNLTDYLFEAPRVAELQGGVPGYAPLWQPSWSKSAPAGACFCRTLGIVGPGAKEFQTYLEMRYADWHDDWKRNHGSPSLADNVLLERECPANVKRPLFQVFESEDDMSELLGYFRYGMVNRTRGSDSTGDRLCGAVVFENDFRNESVPRVRVRTNITGVDISGLSATKRVNRDQMGVKEQSASFWWYLRSGFLSIQELAEDFVLETRLGHSAAEEWRMIDFVPLPTDPFTVNTFTQALGGWLASAGAATIMFASLIMNVTSLMIRERNSKQKELMRLMGLFDSALSLSWVMLFAATNFVASIGCTMLIYSSWVKHSDSGVLVLIIFFCAMSTSFLGMMVSTFISTERLGALVAAGLYNLMGLAFLFLTVGGDDDGSGKQGFGSDIPETVSSNELYLFSLVPQIAFTLCMQTFLKMDEKGLSCNFLSMFDTYEKYSVGWGIFMLFFDCIFYGVLYVYFEQVMPHDVGLARPWYFPLDPAFWRELVGASSLGSASQALGIAAGSTDGEQEHGSSDLFEEESCEQLQQLRNRNLVISVRGLRMDFKNAAGATVRAVDGLNLTMYQGECFCLLGHNGAGKSTTMAILTGMLPQTAGEVRVLGHRLPEERAVVRSQMGFCMQQNVLWETLTVEEHIHLFGALMGLSPDVTMSSCDEVLEKVELNFKRKAPASSLSGGMKRKLNVAMALLGNARILFLDEPTAGMDPHTRRQLWEMLKQTRTERIVCLTTHYMDEADELGDRIAIMVSGRAACSGTNAFLKHRLGCGYMLNFVKASEAVKNAPIVALVRRHCGDGISEASTVGRELRLRVPFAGAAAFPQLMKALDLGLGSLGLESYGVGVSDLEDVFLKIASGHTSSGGGGGTPSSPRALKTPPLPAGGSTASFGEASHRHQASFSQQFGGLYMRRVRYASRDSRTFFCQLVLPVAYMMLFMMISKFGMSANLGMDYQSIVLDTGGWNTEHTSDFAPTLVSVGVTNNCTSCEELGNAWLRQEWSHNSVDTVVNDSLHIDKYDPYGTGILARGNKAPGTQQRVGQFVSEVAFADYAYDVAHASVVPQFGGVLYTDGRVTVFPNTTAQYSAAALLNLHYSARIAAHGPQPPSKGAVLPLQSISVSNQPLEATAVERAVGDSVSGWMMGFVVRVAHAFVPAGIAGYIAMEREMEVRHQLMVSGTGRYAYWFSNLAFDLTFGIFSAAGTLAVFAAMGSEQWLSVPNVYATLTMLALFVPAISMSTYFWSNFFSTSGGAMSAILMANFIIGSFGLDISSLLIMFPKTRMIGWVLLWTARLLFPCVCLGSGFQKLAMTHGVSEYISMDPFSGFVFGTEYRMEGMGSMPPLTLAGDDVFMLAFDAVLFTVLLILTDGHGERGLLGWPLRRRVRCPDELRQKDDQAVADERARVQGLDPSSQVLIVDDVHKSYNGVDFAVRGITFAVEAGHVFGLLGVNGAGKTTTFKMMCGELEPSAGRILVGGKDVSKDLDGVCKMIGYCPQFNALLDLLTVREHLELYGKVKGLAGPELQGDIQDKIRTFDLAKFEHSRAAQLSGGNMRKLSCAIAMIGEPPIIFLDEPSAGMDPVARRFMWDVIQSIAQRRQGSAVILTTHSMEEADALCSRIAIQASGQIKCLGTPQQLKDLYGTGLELNVRLEVPSRASVQVLCAKWGGQAEETRQIADARLLAAERLKDGFQAAAPTCGFFSEQRSDPVPLGVLAEWCLVHERIHEVEQFLHKQCGGEAAVSCVERTGRSLSFRLSGSCPGGGPLPYGELFGLLQGSQSALGFSDFQLSQGTLERTFNRLAAEDLEQSEAKASESKT